ncbi:MAG: uridine diphosphate-N-acetylglucosamine-binding protein YvcK [Myxococcaceae bacterium]
MDGHVEGTWTELEQLRAREELDGEQERNQVIPAAAAQRPTKIVALGGGTGLPTVLKGLARKADPRPGEPGIEITAVVAMADDGGSSGRLRRTRGMLPPGDVRNCLVALAGGKSALSELFQFRFSGKKGLAGHAVGNLLIAALTELKGDFLEAVRVSGRMLGAKGQVLPSTLAPVQLVAHLDDNSRLVGERFLSRAAGRVKRVSLYPSLPPPVEGLIDAIHEADLITLGPGSLYSSVMPNLLVDGVAQALQQTRALKVLVANLMTQPGETEGMNGTEHVKAVIDHVGPVVDVVLVNATAPSDELLEQYGKNGSVPVSFDRRKLLDLGVIPERARTATLRRSRSGHRPRPGHRSRKKGQVTVPCDPPSNI